MDTVLKSAVLLVLFFTETIAPICEPDVQRAEGNYPDHWDEHPRWDPDQRDISYHCVWRSWGSWSGCFVGKKTRYRVMEDDLYNCRCDIEFQTQSCGVFGKSRKLGVALSAGFQSRVNNELCPEKLLAKFECLAAHCCAFLSYSFSQRSFLALC